MFELVRSDAMAYINLTGNPYCNSARYCEYICLQSLLLDNSQSTSRVYRICAHVLIAGITAIFGLYLKGLGLSLYAVFLIIMLAIFISTFFISLHADAAEAIQITYLEHEEFVKRQDMMEDRTGNHGNRFRSVFHDQKKNGLGQDLSDAKVEGGSKRFIDQIYPGEGRR